MWLWLTPRPAPGGGLPRPRWFDRLSGRLSRTKAGEIERLIAAHLAGEDRLADLARFGATRQTEDSIAALLPSLSGETWNRLSRLAAELGLVARWEKQTRSGTAARRKQAFARLLELSWGVVADSTVMAALLDSNECIRIEAGRALLRSGGPRDVETVFDFAVSQPAQVRMALAADLRRHALALAGRAIPDALRSEDPARVCVALELVETWGKALPLPDVAALLRHSDPGIRTRAVRAIPYETCLCGGTDNILRALADESPEVRSAASIAAARLRIMSAVPAILAFLRDEATAPAAAIALAEMGVDGLAALEREVRLGWDPATAAAALLAVDRARSEEYGYARL